MKAMSGVKAPLFLGVWENSWKEQQTLFACTQGRRRSIDDLSRKNRRGKAY